MTILPSKSDKSRSSAWFLMILKLTVRLTCCGYFVDFSAGSVLVSSVKSVSTLDTRLRKIFEEPIQLFFH